MPEFHGKSHGLRSLAGYSPGVAKSQTGLSDFTFTFHRGSTPAPSSASEDGSSEANLAVSIAEPGAFQVAQWLSPPATVGNLGSTSVGNPSEGGNGNPLQALPGKFHG
ncbi:unnamed protein product [Rangifer tarandus platyrhynchus]|uniref:Uncharacterized protein n=1 Tax=Rangifer tarandus platyrhynchus TaxID=3082113 RepID=A0AC59YWP9_RANTA